MVYLISVGQFVGSCVKGMRNSVLEEHQAWNVLQCVPFCHSDVIALVAGGRSVDPDETDFFSETVFNLVIDFLQGSQSLSQSNSQVGRIDIVPSNDCI